MSSRLKSRRKTLVKKISAKGTKARATAGKENGTANFDFEPKTELGKKLWAARERIVASGAELLDWHGVHRELMLRRGGVSQD